MDAWIGLAGTVIGAAITHTVTWTTRRQDQATRRRDTLFARAEELAAIVAGLADWQMKCFQVARAGGNELPPWILFRFQVLVTVYLPEVEPSARAVHTAIAEVQDFCAKIADLVRRQPGQPLPLESTEAVKGAMKLLTTACVKMTEAISERMKAAQIR
jgi:hypothetical protein